MGETGDAALPKVAAIRVARPGRRRLARYGSNIYWLETAPPRPPARRLEGRARYDVVIVGGGFTGLWTAYHLLSEEPGLRVALLEREEIGYGASGRNGGFSMTLLDMSLHHLVRNNGVEAARAVHEAAAKAVQLMADTVRREGIECELDYGGLLTVATNEAQERKIARDLAAAESIGAADIRPLTGEEVRARVNSPTYRMGFEEDHCAVLHPAKLVRGLADVAERRGLDIFEFVEVRALVPAAGGVRVVTEQGDVEAGQVVLALSAWAAHSSEFERDLAPVYTYVILTEPIPDELWKEVGWEGRQGIEDKRVHIHFTRRTRDGRILWGGRENIQTYGGDIGPHHDADDRVFHLLRGTFARTFPQLARVRFTHAWGGPVDITPTFMPVFGSTAGGRIHYGHGYCGHGVGPSHLGGQILTDLALRRWTERTELCFVNAPRGRWPREPARFIGGYLTRRESLWFDEAQEVGKGRHDEPRLLQLATKLFAPRFTRPKGRTG